LNKNKSLNNTKDKMDNKDNNSEDFIKNVEDKMRFIQKVNKLNTYQDILMKKNDKLKSTNERLETEVKDK
jgi:hypothetical protein